MVALQDVYLQTNTLAALANLAPHCTGINSHAAQRLVSLFELLARRLQRLEHVPNGDAAHVTNGAQTQHLRRSLPQLLWSASVPVWLPQPAPPH